MAWTEYAAVRSSTVYENKGIAKPLLLMVTWLIEHAEEGKQPGEHEGYCYASVKYLAESLGCSESAVEKWIDRFVADGWVSKETSRDKNGHQHNRYCLASGVLGRLAALKRVRGEERPKNTNKSRPSCSERVGGKFASGSPAGTTRASRLSDGCQPARSGKANRNGAGKPTRSERNPDPLGAGECVDDMFLDEFCDELKQSAAHSTNLLRKTTSWRHRETL